ncbi:hypothetical protein ACFV23_03860 [Streptomyces sp. NPDC059627]
MRYIRLSSSAAVAAAVVTCVTGGPAAAGGGDDSSTPVACNTLALTTAILGASPGETLSLSSGCIYELTTPIGSSGDGLPAIDQNLTIQGNGVLVLKGSKVLSNSANGPSVGSNSAQGGGIFNNNGGSVTLDHSHVRNNSATVAPGGVFTTNQFTVKASTITRNTPTNCAGSPTIVTGCTN